MFDVNKFESVQFKDRTRKIKVNELKAFFEEGTAPEWEVRGLTAHELSIVNNAVSANTDKAALVDAILGGSSVEKADAIRQSLNIIKTSDNVPDDLVRRYATVRLGSVNPVCSEEMAVKLGNNFPTVLYQLSQKIYELTGQGRLGE